MNQVRMMTKSPNTVTVTIPKPLPRSYRRYYRKQAYSRNKDYETSCISTEIASNQNDPREYTSWYSEVRACIRLQCDGASSLNRRHGHGHGIKQKTKQMEIDRNGGVFVCVCACMCAYILWKEEREREGLRVGGRNKE